MKIWYSDYQLKPKQKLNSKVPLSPRSGFLLKVEWTAGVIGYSDVFPWPEFGDPSLEDLKLELSEKTSLGPLASSSLFFNREDAQARKRGRSLFLSLPTPECHSLLDSNDLLASLKDKRSSGFSRFKVKMMDSTDLKPLFSELREGEKLRLDFNASLTFEQFENFWKALSDSEKRAIDFVEDPWSPGDNSKTLNERAPLASDFVLNSQWPIRIIKPARDLFKTSKLHQRVIFTHSMEHPVGQAFALWFASRFHRDHPQKKEVHGVSPNHPYESFEFSQLWTESGPRPKPPQGQGVGFTDLLKEQRWISM